MQFRFDFALISSLFLAGLIHAHTGDSPHVPPIRHYEYLGTSTFKKTLDRKVHISFNAYNTSFHMELLPTQHLIGPESVVEIQTKDGIITRPITHQEILAYDGSVFIEDGQDSKRKAGWARIVFHSNPYDVEVYPRDHIFEGAFETFDFGLHHIKTIENYSLSKRQVDVNVKSPYKSLQHHRRSGMIIFRDVDQDAPLDITEVSKRGLVQEEFVSTCGFTGSKMNEVPRHSYHALLDTQLENKLHKRQSTGCPVSLRILAMGVAADCTYVANYGGESGALKQILSNWNLASQLYEKSFNVALRVTMVKLQMTCGTLPAETTPMEWNVECSSTYSITDRLSDFSEWRGKKTADKAGLWHLMTRCNSGASLGIAWLGMLCATTSQMLVGSNGVTQFTHGTGVSSIAATEWKVIAHEIGHNFGAIHDCSSTTCPTTCNSASSATLDTCSCCPCSPCDCDGVFLMHPTDNSKTGNFSACSISSICGQLPKLGTCLLTPEAFTTSFTSIQDGICGNGVVDGTEQCDCGQDCATDNCCDGATCKFKNGATCDDLNHVCCSGCQLKSSGTSCRPSVGVCDYAEVCDGQSGSCPVNTFLPNGASCSIPGPSSTTCASGVCTSRDLQCQSYSSILNLTSSCSATSCSLNCQNSRGVCSIWSGFFLDGTPCGVGGQCQSGTCNSNTLSQITDWFRANPSVAIPVTVVVGLLVLSIVICFIRSCCCSQVMRKRSLKKAQKQTQRNTAENTRPRDSFYGAPLTSPLIANDLQQRQYTSYQSINDPIMPSESASPTTNWVDPEAYNGPPSHPRPSYMQQQQREAFNGNNAASPLFQPPSSRESPFYESGERNRDEPQRGYNPFVHGRG